MKKYYLFIVLIYGLILSSFAQDSVNKRPMVEEHRHHKHIIDVNNVFLYQIDASSGEDYLVDILKLFTDLKLKNNAEIFFHIGIGIGDKYNKDFSYLSNSTFGGDTKEYIENVNNTKRKYLLEVWYHQDIEKMHFAVGIIDSTSFIDDNNYANDETLQFLNSSLINNPVANLPSYNLGALIGIKPVGNQELKLVVIDNDPLDGVYVASQYWVKINFLNLRPYVYKTLNSQSNIEGIGISSDIKIDKFGIFFRLGRGSNEERFISFGGIYNISKDTLGVGFANIGKNENKVIEVYYKHILMRRFNITFDYQYINEGKSYDILSVRALFKY